MNAKILPCGFCGKDPHGEITCHTNNCFQGGTNLRSVAGWNEDQIRLAEFIESKEREAFYAGHCSCQQNGEHRLESQFDEWKRRR